MNHLLHEPPTPLLSVSHLSCLNKCSTAPFPFSHFLTLIEWLLHHLLFALNFMHPSCLVSILPARLLRKVFNSQKRCLPSLHGISQIYSLPATHYITYLLDFLSPDSEVQKAGSYPYCNVSLYFVYSLLSIAYEVKFWLFVSLFGCFLNKRVVSQ